MVVQWNWDGSMSYATSIPYTWMMMTVAPEGVEHGDEMPCICGGV